MIELETEIEELERSTRNAADEADKLAAEIKQIMADYDGAAEAVAGESSTRAKAEAIKKVVSQIVVTFKPTGRSWPVGEVERIEIRASRESFTDDRSMMRSQ